MTSPTTRKEKKDLAAKLILFESLLQHGLQHDAACLREKAHEVLVEIQAVLLQTNHHKV